MDEEIRKLLFGKTFSGYIWDFEFSEMGYTYQ